MHGLHTAGVVGSNPTFTTTLIMKNTLIINGCTLVRTCYACPEQYDVFFHDFQIGYLRLRHGNFTAEYPENLIRVHNNEVITRQDAWIDE